VIIDKLKLYVAIFLILTLLSIYISIDIISGNTVFYKECLYLALNSNFFNIKE